MQLRKLLHDDNAVSPVIGVILMVAITVILAAVIASFVLGLGDQADNVAPQASFSFDYDGDQNNLTVSHDGGEALTASEMVLRGDGLTDGDAATTVDEIRFDADTQESSDTGPLFQNITDEMSSGQSIEANVTRSYDIDVVWDPEDTDDSSILASDDGPDA